MIDQDFVLFQQVFVSVQTAVYLNSLPHLQWLESGLFSEISTERVWFNDADDMLCQIGCEFSDFVVYLAISQEAGQPQY